MELQGPALAISRHIWESRYRYTDESGRTEGSLEDTWRRVARALAAVENEDRPAWEHRFLQVLRDFRFLPGGRVLAGAGSHHKVTLFNCFVMGVIEDSMEGIFTSLKEAAITMQQGGGIGYDFSTLRPRGTRASTTGTIASGPVSFMRIWDSMCATVLSTGARRGAMMATLRCDHPDILEFVNAKRTAGQLTRFNLSVQITDAFMEAVKTDGTWPLVFPARQIESPEEGTHVMRRWSGGTAPEACRVVTTVRAKELWREIMQATYDNAEPGVLFVDRVAAMDNLWYTEEPVTATNPCGEIPLPPYGACDLGSVNLARFVNRPFSARAQVDWTALTTTAVTATRLLDNVIDVSRFPLANQARQARGSRRIGLGVTGLADMLSMLGLHYDSTEARGVAGRVAELLCHTAYQTSIHLAAEKGSFPFFDAQRHLEGGFAKTLPPAIRDGIAKHGIRNSHLTAIAPTGTISLLAGNVTSGIEPLFAMEYERSVLRADGQHEHLRLADYAYGLWRSQAKRDADAPSYFVRADRLEPEAHLAMQAALQPFVDNAISKTINVPESYPLNRFSSIYARAHELGLKGCTTYRPNPVTGAVLTANEDQGGTRGESGVHCCTIEREAD